jgi:hypothetical protein
LSLLEKKSKRSRLKKLNNASKNSVGSAELVQGKGMRSASKVQALKTVASSSSFNAGYFTSSIRSNEQGTPQSFKPYSQRKD